MAQNFNEGLLPFSSSPLFAASFLIGNNCRYFNDFFMYCKSKSTDPFLCLPLGILVKSCVKNQFEIIKQSSCHKLFTNFWHCLDYNSQMLMYCRPEEEIFYECIKESGLKGHKKELWKGTGPSHEAGIKDEDYYPEKNKIWYKWHVYNYKYKYPKE
jgi:NADH dehydrogenase (ubiquinone) 1 alpha subcomplex subunit 8